MSRFDDRLMRAAGVVSVVTGFMGSAMSLTFFGEVGYVLGCIQFLCMGIAHEQMFKSLKAS